MVMIIMTILPEGMLCHNHINRIFSRGDVVSQQGLQPSPRLHLPHLPPSNNNKSGQKQFCIFVCLYFGSYCYFGTPDQMHVFVFGISTNQVRILFVVGKTVSSLAWLSFAVKWVTKMSCRAAGS